MRIYDSLYEAVKETERELIEMGTIVAPETMQDKNILGNKDYRTKELQGYSYMITERKDAYPSIIDLGANIRYIEEEFDNRIDPRYLNPGTSWKIREEVWKPFLHNMRFSYTYNTRYREQLDRLIEELEERPHTRQAVMTMYDRHQDMENWGGVARIPCSMYYQFLRRTRNREEYLDVIYTMRSCDLYTHFIYDVYLTLILQDYIAGKLGIKGGHFTHFIGSLHAYYKDFKDKGVF